MKTQRVWLAVLFMAAYAHAEVIDSGTAGFTVKETVAIKAAPADVYKRFFRVGDWWNSQHTFSGDAHNLSLEERAGGCLCEKLPNGGGVQHMTIVSLMPGKSVVLHGALGPLQSLAAAGAMVVALTPADGGTKLEVTYSVAGYLPTGMAAWAARVDGMVKEQFTRLKSLIENGDPAK